MTLASAVKQLSISTGLYRPARWLHRRLRASRLHAFEREVAFYNGLLRPKALCFDVGANIGEKSEILLAAGARVVAFEPNARVVPELRARCGASQAWTLVESALGETATQAAFYVRASHGQSGLRRDWEGTVIETAHVPVIPLDAAIARFGRPDYCKIDVEGWELEVLEGLTSRLMLLSLEFHLSPTNLQKTRECLTRISLNGLHEVNVLPTFHSAFHFPSWMPLDRFLAWFPGDLATTMPGPPYADLYVRPTRLSVRN